MNLVQFVIGLVLGAGLSTAAYLTGNLTWSGALAAVVVGTLTFGFGGLMPALLLILFFTSSSTLSRIGTQRKRIVIRDFAKGRRRDHGQVFANGGLTAGLAVLFGSFKEPLWLIGILGAMAAVTADTWATELGILARSRPRLITSWRPVPTGTSGAVTIEGTIAGLAGSVLIGLTAYLLHGPWQLIPTAVAGGLAGSWVDSLLGATLQANYHCPVCEKDTEQHPHHVCGSETQPVRGWRWLGNDAVNFIASVIGAVVAASIWLLFD
jgi:uncharacterized protein (TIGR00297 family)